MSRALPMYMPHVIINVAAKLILIAERIGDKGERVQASNTLKASAALANLLITNLTALIDLEQDVRPECTLYEMVNWLKYQMSNIERIIEQLTELDHHDLAAELQEQLEKLQRELRDNARMLEGKR